MKVFSRRFCASAAAAALVFSQLGTTAWAEDKNKQDIIDKNINVSKDESTTSDESTTGDETVTDYETGDANGDGEINVTDISMIAAHIKGQHALSKSGAAAADINEDGDVNVTDISLVAAHIKGIKSIGWEKLLEVIPAADVRKEPAKYTKLKDTITVRDNAVISWDAVSGAAGYTVSFIKNNKEISSATVIGTSTEISSDRIGDAEKVSYKIKPYKLVNTETATAVKTYMDGLEGDIYFKPDGITSDINFDISLDRIKASWGASWGASCYDVYLASNGSEKLLERSDDTSCEFECAPSVEYTLKVVAVKKITIDGKETELRSESEKTGTVRSRQRYDKAYNKLDQIGWNIRSAYNWCTTLIDSSAGLETDSSTGMEFYADHGFDNNRGNCYVASACLCEMALMMGYDAHMVSGFYKNSNGNWVDHAWVEIDNYAGTDQTYIFDPYFRIKTGASGFELRYGDPGSWDYDYNGEFYKHRMN